MPSHSRTHIKSLAQAVRRTADRQHANQARHPHYAEVVDTDPLSAELHDSDQLLVDGEDLVLAQWVRHYDYTYSLDVGDTLVVHRMPDGDWIASDVISESDPWP